VTATVTPTASVPAALVPVGRRVLAVRRETSDVVTLSLESAGDGAPSFAPGQFNMLYAFGIGEAALSMSGDPGDRSAVVHTVRALGAVTRAICAAKAGDVIGLRGPFGRPWPMEEADGNDLLVVAGGLGLAPLRPVIYHAIRNRARYGRVLVLVGARDPAALLFADELGRWRDDPAAGLDVRLIVDRAGPAWTGRVGVVPDLVPDEKLDPNRTFVLMCGPEVMMKYTLRPLSRLGIPDARIFLSLERSMRCAVAFCGHCQLGPAFVCKDGPVLPLDRLRPWLFAREL
jgi:NAD(P)H-flavin reductase